MHDETRHELHEEYVSLSLFFFLFFAYFQKQIELGTLRNQSPVMTVGDAIIVIRKASQIGKVISLITCLLRQSKSFLAPKNRFSSQSDNNLLAACN